MLRGNYFKLSNYCANFTNMNPKNQSKMFVRRILNGRIKNSKIIGSKKSQVNSLVLSIMLMSNSFVHNCVLLINANINVNYDNLFIYALWLLLLVFCYRLKKFCT